MTRAWYKVHGANTFVASKWRKTPYVVRGALLSLWTIASMQTVEGRWDSRDDVVEELELDGCPKADEVVDRLIALRWLDCDESGCVVHDWREWQEDMPEPKTGAQRTAEWRARKAIRDAGDVSDDAASPSVTPRHGDEASSQSDGVTLERGDRENLEAPSLRSGDKRLDPVVSKWFRDQGMTAPNGYVANDLKALVTGYGPERVIAAMIESDGRTAKERVKGAERLLAPTNGAGRYLSPKLKEVQDAFES